MIPARRAALLEWYDRSRRPLPWRDGSDPYAVLVSEVMAQQTQISRVVPHYERFLEQFPTIAALAAASLGEVLTAWSGLGYNRRARYLHEAARAIAADGWPTTAAGLQALPGVGPYTAAAVACFAFAEAVPAVDTNMRRVLSRWRGRELAGEQLHEAGSAELDPDRPADWNQAVMDLGAGVCTVRRPRCGDCPVATWCADPTIYAPPPTQASFAGSTREARGAVLKALIDGGPARTADLARASGLSKHRLEPALNALRAEGMIHRRSDDWLLATDHRPPNTDL